VARVVGIDPGTVSIDICGIAGDQLWLDRSVPTSQALGDPAAFVSLLVQGGTPDLIAGPSGYGLPLVAATALTDEDLRLALLSSPGESGGLGGLGRLMRLLAESGLPVVFTPGVILLPSVPNHRKLNRVDLGTADKVAVAALAVWERSRIRGTEPAQSRMMLLELGGAFTAALAIESGAIVDGIGGTGGPPGWRSAGAWDGEVAFLAGRISKDMLFAGGREGNGESGLEAYVEGAEKAVLSLTAAVPRPDEIVLSGRMAQNPEVRAELYPRLARIAPVVDLQGFAKVAKQGAQGAALLADGLVGGECRAICDALRIREASGTVLDHLRVITPDDARRRLGLA